MRHEEAGHQHRPPAPARGPLCGRPQTSEYDLTGLDEDVTAQFTGDTIIVNNAEGKFIFEKAVRIKGNLKTTGVSEFGANAYVEGNFEAAGATTFSARADIAGTVTANANITFADDAKAKTGVITVADDKTLTAKFGENDIAGITINGGNANVNGKVGAVKVDNGGQFNSDATANATTLTIVDGTANTAAFTAVSADVQIEGNFNANGNLNISDKLAVVGKATATKVNKIKTLEVGSNAVVAVTGVTYGTPATAPSIETVTVKAGTNNKGNLTANDITLGTVTNNGVITAGDVTVSTKFDNNYQFAGNVTVSGTFNQKGSFVKIGSTWPIVTVTPSGIFDVQNVDYDEAKTAARLINDGTVKVYGKQNNAGTGLEKIAQLTLASGSKNNGTIEVKGKLLEGNSNNLTQESKSYIKVYKYASFEMAAGTTDAPKASAVIELMDNAAEFKNASTPVDVAVAYTWTTWKDDASVKPTNGAINTIFVSGVPGNSSVIDELVKYNLIFKSNFALAKNMTMGAGKSVTIAENVTISSDKATNKAEDQRTLILNGDGNKILAGKKLTLTDQVTIDGAAGTKIAAGSGATIVTREGGVTTNVTVTLN